MVKRTLLQTIPSFTEASNIRYYLKITNNEKEESNGKQIYDNSDGSYLPDRKVTPLVFQPVVRLEDPNILTSDGKATVGNARITSVVWYTSDGKYDTSGKPILTEISTVAGKTVIVANINTGVFQLKYYINTPSSESGRKICCKVNYNDPNSSSSQSIMMEETLTTTVSASISLSLGSEPDLSSTSKLYVCDGYELNPMACPRVDENGDELEDSWKRYLRCQLRNGSLAVKDAHADSDDYESDRTGNAFYFWYQVVDGREHLITDDVEWFDGTFFADGTASKECCVDLGKIQTVHLRCYAGYIPYGELDDFVDESGMIVPSKCKYGYLYQDFRLNVRMQPIDSYKIVDLTPTIIYKRETNRKDVPVKKRLIINSRGMTLNDMAIVKAPSTLTLVERLFNITWELAVKNENGNVTDWTVISNREFLETTTKDLGMTATSEPQLRVSVEPRYPSLYGNNYVVGYNDNSLDVIPMEMHGNKEWLRQYDFVLCDMSQTYEKTSSGATYLAQKSIRLRRDNLLRNTGGDYAPVVVISDEQYGDSLLALYTKSGSTYTPYCSEGSYDAERYVEEMLRPFYAGSKTIDAIKLYKKNTDGTYSEAHALLPWETTDDRWSVFLDAFGRDVYFLDNVVGKSGTCWRGIFSDLSNVEDGKWDGIDISKYLVRRTGISPCPVATVTYGGKTVTRNMFYLKQGSEHCQGSAGANNCTYMLKDSGRTYPRVYDMQALKLAEWSRNNNPDATKPYPCAEGGYNNMSQYITALEMIHGSKALYGANMYGSGISSNESCNSEATFLLSGGTRMRKSSSDAFQYRKWSDNAPFKPSSTASATHMTGTLNGEYPKEQCMESQIVLSFAKEFGIAPNTWFTVYGGSYKYVTPSGCKGLADGYMNARVYKDVGGTVNGYNTSTSAAETWNVEAMLRMSICGGLNLCGDILSYWPGGSDIIYTVLNDPSTNRNGNRIEAYYELDQLKWVNDRNVSLKSNVQFESQKAYTYSHTYEPTSSHWIVKRCSYTPIPAKTQPGGHISGGECCYVDVYNWGFGSDLTVHQRAALRFRYNASHSTCAPRSMHANHPATSAHVNNGGSAQVLL